MTAQTTAGRPRPRELRMEVVWTQQQLADKPAHLAWTHGQGHAAVNADMVAKWERGVKGIRPPAQGAAVSTVRCDRRTTRVRSGCLGCAQPA